MSGHIKRKIKVKTDEFGGTSLEQAEDKEIPKKKKTRAKGQDDNADRRRQPLVLVDFCPRTILD